MINVLFVCHGNICRSPMAEFLMKDLVEKAGLKEKFYIESAATSTEEIGAGVYPQVRRILNDRGIDCSEKRARQMTAADYDRFDYIICMDEMNLRNMKRISADPYGKYRKLLDFAGETGDVADPWYTGNFSITQYDIERGCKALLETLLKG